MEMLCGVIGSAGGGRVGSCCKAIAAGQRRVLAWDGSQGLVRS